MPAELLAVTAAFCFASGAIAVKLATRTGNVMPGFLIGLSVNALVVAVVALAVVDSWAMPALPAALFALAGLSGPGLARLLMMRSVRDAGASVAVPLQASSNPLISSFAGLVVFHESSSGGRLAALGVTVAGIWSCARGGSANRSSEGGRDDRGGGARFLVLSLPLAAGAAYASSDILRKAGLTRFDEPILGALIGTVTALSVWSAAYALRPTMRAPVVLGPSFAWFVLNGLLIGAAQVALLVALSVGDLSVVSPIVASQPVIVIVLSALVLRDVERLRWGSVLGAALVVVGVVWLTVST